MLNLISEKDSYESNILQRHGERNGLTTQNIRSIAGALCAQLQSVKLARTKNKLEGQTMRLRRRDQGVEGDGHGEGHPRLRMSHIYHISLLQPPALNWKKV